VRKVVSFIEATARQNLEEPHIDTYHLETFSPIGTLNHSAKIDVWHGGILEVKPKVPFSSQSPTF